MVRLFEVKKVLCNNYRNAGEPAIAYFFVSVSIRLIKRINPSK
jgi:hypothetical protein